MSVAIVGLVAAAIVGIGWFGARADPTPLRGSVSAAPVAAASASAPPSAPASAGPSAPALGSRRAGPAPPVVFASAEFGYFVRATDTPGEQIQPLDGWSVAFVRSRISLAARGYGTITVIVGPGDRGLPVGIPDVTVFGPDLAGLERVFIPAAEADVLQRTARNIDGQPATILDLQRRDAGRGAATSVALLAVDGRDFAIFAEGFDAGNPTATRAARFAALLEFLDRLGFSQAAPTPAPT